VTGWAQALLRVHLACAGAATLLFWAAAVLPKGGGPPRAAGRWFARILYGAAATGGVLALTHLFTADAATRRVMWLALYVLLIIVAPVQHGLAVVGAGADPRRLRTWPHATLCLLAMLGSVVLLPAMVVWQQATWLVVAPIGFVVGFRQMAYAGRSQATPAEWRREHLTSQLTAGITFHTTLLVFGTARTLGWQLQGWHVWLPWILPAAIGLPILLWLRRT
jgi:hypothetical protein